MDLAVRGCMPVTEWLPYNWYDTPNIHLFSLQDILNWADEHNVLVLEGYVLSEGEIRKLKKDSDNLYAEEVLLVLKRNV